jgi:hypothetical protein
VFNPYNSYSWTSCLFSTINTIKEIPKESLKQWTYNTHTIDCKLKKIRETLSTTLEHNQHDVSHMKTSSLKRKDYTLLGNYVCINSDSSLTNFT